MKKFSSKITVVVSYNVHDNVFIRAFPIAAMLNPSLKVVLCKSLVDLVVLKNLATRT